MSEATNYINTNLLEIQGEFGVNKIMAESIIYIFNNKYLVDSLQNNFTKETKFSVIYLELFLKELKDIPFIFMSTG